MLATTKKATPHPQKTAPAEAEVHVEYLWGHMQPDWSPVKPGIGRWNCRRAQEMNRDLQYIIDIPMVILQLCTYMPASRGLFLRKMRESKGMCI